MTKEEKRHMVQSILHAKDVERDRQSVGHGESVTGDTSRRILIVSHSYSPLLSPRAFRWSALAEFWVTEGREVDVVTSHVAGLPGEEERNGVRVFRCGGGIVEKLRDRFRPAERATSAGASGSDYVGGADARPMRSVLKSAIRMAHDVSWKNLYWPDYACLWINPAVGKVRELVALREYDTLITVSDPFSSHVVGMRVRPHMRNYSWLVDIGDPFCFRSDTPANNQTLYRRLNQATEEKVFAQADVISVTTDSTMKKYANLFPDQKAKIAVIPPLVANVEASASDASKTIVETGASAVENGPVTLVFLGTLYRAIRNPEYLLKLFSELSAHRPGRQLQLHFYGGYDECQKYFTPYENILGKSVFLHGLVDRKEALSAMNSADFLVNIGNDNPYQLPSKVIEYACAGKPIINLSQRSDDCSADFLKYYPIALTLDASGTSPLEDQVKALGSFIDNPPGKPDERYLTNLRREFCVGEISHAYLASIRIERSERTAVL